MLFRCTCSVACATVLLVLLSSCRTSTGVDLVSIPASPHMTKVADILIPEDLAYTAEGLMFSFDWPITVQRVFRSGTLDERRALVYIFASHYSGEILPHMSLFTRDNNPTANNLKLLDIASQIEAPRTGELRDSGGKDMMRMYDLPISTRQAAADLADNILTQYSDTVWCIELSFNGDMGL